MWEEPESCSRAASQALSGRLRGQVAEPTVQPLSLSGKRQGQGRWEELKVRQGQRPFPPAHSIGSNREKGRRVSCPGTLWKSLNSPGALVVWHFQERGGQQQEPKLHTHHQFGNRLSQDTLSFPCGSVLCSTTLQHVRRATPH